MNDPLAWLDPEAAERDRLGLQRSLVVADRSLINFASNDYLGLAGDPRVIAAASESAAKYGWGAGASPLVAGWKPPHQELSESLAEFEQVEAVTLFPTGFAANLGAITSLVGKGDAVYLDRLNHACLIDSARLSGASLRVYPHNDSGRLASILTRDRGRFRRSLIATDGVFSMDGDLAPIAELADMAERFDAMLLVDEAHGTAVFGPEGRGASAECGVADRVHVRVGTLSKALGSIGGFAAGSSRLIDHLINRARTLIYSTSLPPAAAAAANEALRIARAEPWRRERARSTGDRLRRSLTALGFEIPPSSGPIVPILLGDPEEAVGLSTSLRARGFFVPAIRPPTVPEGTSRLRTSVSAITDDADVSALVAALGDARGPSGQHL